MPATHVSIAEWCKAKLNKEPLCLQFRAERSYGDWKLELEDEQLHVDILTHTTEQKADIASRGEMVLEVPVVIAVRKRFTQEQLSEKTGRVLLAEIDKLSELVEQIWWTFRPQNLSDFTLGEWIETKIVVNPDHKMITDNSQFTGVVKIVFQVYRDA